MRDITHICILCLGVIFFWSSCTEDVRSIDDTLIVAINTNANSQGLSYYKIPSSDDFARIPQDPRNPLTADKVNLGKMLFHETGLGTIGEFGSLSRTYSCASCHHAAGGFQANLPQGIGDGGIGYGAAGEGRQVDLFVEKSKIDVQPLRTPSAMNVAYQTNMLWNGQFGATGVNVGTESKWPTEGPIATNYLGYAGVETQAIAGLAVHRLAVNADLIAELGYKEIFDLVFPEVDDEHRYTRETAGLAIAAYERTMLSNEAPFQYWLRGNYDAMSDKQKEGAIIFFSKGQCTNCHNGPGLANMEFEAIGLSDFDPSEVNNHEEDDPAFLGRGSFTKEPRDHYKFKVPQLYNLKNSPFYGHGASFRSIRDLIAYKNEAIPQNSNVPQEQLSTHFYPLGLSEIEIDQLTAFINYGLYDPNLERYQPEQVMSTLCFPNNDWKSKEELHCK